MAIDRRQLLAGIAATPLAAILGSTVHGRETAPLFAACRVDAEGAASAAIIDASARDIASVVLPERGHDAAIHPNGRDCVVFARRPGNFAVAFGTEGLRPPLWIEAAPGRHFYGHGVFSPDGRLLYSPENDYEAARGVIGIRDASDGYRQIGEFESFEIGPHDAALLSDGRTLVIANGGIETHPDYPEEDLNLATMSPSLSYVDVHSGDLLEEHRLDASLNRLSIRHLSVGANDVVAFGCQYEGPESDRPPLIGFHRRGADPVLAEAPDGLNGAMNNYIGSVAADRSGEFVVFTAPRGGLVTYWDVATRRMVGHMAMNDACGSGALEHGFLISSGEERLAMAADPTHGDVATLIATPGVHWDNHLRRLC